MKNYYLYRNNQHIGSFDNKDQGVQWTEANLKGWRATGCPGHAEYKLCYNGSKSVTLAVWPANTWTMQDIAA